MKLKSRENPTMKLPSSFVLPDIYENLPEIPIFFSKISNSYQEIYYELIGDIACIYFPFYNGAIGKDQCY